MNKRRAVQQVDVEPLFCNNFGFGIGQLQVKK